MTIDKACCVLRNSKQYWSHEVEEAKQIAIKVFIIIVMQPEFMETLLRLRTLWDDDDAE